VFDSVAIRIDGPKAWDEHVVIAWNITDEDTTHVTELRNGVMHHRTVTAAPEGVTTFSLTRHTLIGLITGSTDLAAALGDATVSVEGDPAVLGRLVGLVGDVDPDFDIVLP
jgi:alkyl sulfatase BDS1-like metallo-beta-lactamase superfamily hydrolase